MDLNEKVYAFAKWTHLAHNKIPWPDFVNTVINFHILLRGAFL